MEAAGPLEFTIAVEDFDRELLPPGAREVGTEEFERGVITYYQRQFAEVGGAVEIDMDEEQIHLLWRPDEASEDPFAYALSLLERGDLEAAIPLLESLLRASPNDSDVLYNLGMAYSDTGRIREAIRVLVRCTEVDSQNANALVALGVAHQRNGEYSEAMQALRAAIDLEPGNPHAHRNLGGILASLGGFADAEPHLRETVRLMPEDQRALYGLAATLERVGGEGQEKEADELHQRAIEADPASEIAELSRQARSRMARESFRDASGGSTRMDATMYCLDALERFEGMSTEDVQSVTLEIALLGRQGLDTNDPTPKYTLRSLTGEFTGLHLVSIMYVGFQRIAPDHDVGFDLSEEYRTARELFSNKKGD